MPNLSRTRWYALLAIGILFTIAGAGMIITGAEHGWAVFLFFGLCTAVFISELWPGLLLHSSTPPDILLQRFPGPVELRVGRPKFLFLLIGAAIFGGVILWMLRHEQFGWFATIVLWLGVIMGAAAIPLMIVLMLQGASLRLDSEGLQVKHGWRTHRTRWAETSVFEVSTLAIPGTPTMVIYDDASSRSGTFGAINASLIGRSGALPDSYGLSHQELAWLLNHWRERALAVRNGRQQGPVAGPPR
jgi:hypothetical protein